MLNLNHVEVEKKIYITVDGYLKSQDVKNFMIEYKQFLKTIKPYQYKLIVEPRYFECENEKDIKNVCMTFMKHGYKKIYLVDEEDYIMSNVKMSSLERKVFLSAVKVVSDKNNI